MNRSTARPGPGPPGAPPSRRRTGLLLGAVLLVLAAVLLVPPALGGLGAGGEEPPLRGLRMLVPNTPGGGYDVTARSAAKAMEESGTTGPVEVFNLPGGAGTVGLGRTVAEAGNDRLTMSMGLGVVGSVYSTDAPATLAGTTPIARLTEESEIVVVPADSPYRDIGGLLEAWRRDPAGTAVGGGSSPGGPDHLAPMLMAEAIGLDPARVDYVGHDGGGELLASVLGGEVAFGVSGLGEFADQVGSGDLRVLAVTAGQRVPGVDAPTLRESGVDVEFANWRGVVAPPGLSDEGRAELERVHAELVRTPEWQETLRRNGWQDAYLPGPEFGTFLRSENDRVERILRRLGLV